MLLAIDIGNTNVVCAVFDGENLVKEFRMATDINRTSDEYTATLIGLMNSMNLVERNFSSSILSSVVPDLTGPFISVVTNITGKKPFLLSSDQYYKLPLKIPQTAVHEIGTDLLANAVEAWKRFKCANIEVDFGTALSIITTDSKANIQGVAIAPGIKTAVHSLFAKTAQLPEVPLVAPKNALGQNTIHSIQAGIILGYKSLVEGLIARTKQDLYELTGDKAQDIKVIATGGLNNVLKPITDVFSDVDKNLTMYGLKTIAEIFTSYENLHVQ